MDKVIQAIYELMTSASGQSSQPLSGINVYYWDPVQIPEQSLPALTIQPISTDYILRGSEYDEKIHTVEIRLVYNQKDFYKTTPTLYNKVYAVQDVIEKTEKTDNSYETINYTISWVIQRNMTLPYTWWYNACQQAKITNISYLFNDSRGFPSYEVVTTVEATVIGNRE